MDETTLITVCGLFCRECEYIGEQCPSCGQVQGKPFWTETFGIEVCPLYDCSINRKQIEHCGLCDEFPCETFTSLRDPSLSDKDAELLQYIRQQNLRQRKEIGTEAWLKERTQNK
jgi:hypothetical protein